MSLEERLRLRNDMPKKDIEDLRIEHFCPCVPWEQLKRIMKARDYKNFVKWMNGQTCVLEGVYVHDLMRYLERGGKNVTILD